MRARVCVSNAQIRFSNYPFMFVPNVVAWLSVADIDLRLLAAIRRTAGNRQTVFLVGNAFLSLESAEILAKR